VTREKVAQIIESIGLPFAYYSFPITEAPQLPFIVYMYPNDDDFIADNQNYVNIRALRIELYQEYTDIDFALIKHCEDVLKQNNIVYSLAEDVITSEQMYRITFESEVLINE